MPTKFKLLIFFSIIFLNFFPQNSLILAHNMSDTTCTCSANDFCAVDTTTQSHCHPYGDDRWSWEGCHFDTGSCYCRPNGCGGGVAPTATPTVVPTATPAPVCPVNVSCCYSPLTRCVVNGQCPVGYQWCYAGMCVKENYNPGTNTCAVPTAAPTLRPTLPPATPTVPSILTPTLSPGATNTPMPTPTTCPSQNPATVSATDGTFTNRIAINWSAVSGAIGYKLYRNEVYCTNTVAIALVDGVDNLICPSVNPVAPTPGTTYTYRVRVMYAGCPDSTGRTDTGYASLTPTPTPTSRWPTPTSPVAYEAWFQSQDGDAHAQGNISDPMSSFPAKIFSLNGDGGFPGVVSFKEGNAYFGSGAISAQDWLAKTGFVLRNFHFYYAFLKSPPAGSFSGAMPASDGVYFADSDQIIASDWELSGGKRVIILVDGNVKILGNIVVPYGSALVLIASGNINFGDQVAQIQGIFLADKKITTGSGSAAFAGEGSFVAGQEMDLGRNFGDIRNRSAPVEKFLFRPDLIVNSPRDLWSTSHVWEELAP